MASTLTNVHPADELQAVREEMAQLEKRADALREILMKEGADLRGLTHTAVIAPGKRETLDRKALVEAFGEEVIAPYVKTTTYKTVKLVENSKT